VSNSRAYKVPELAQTHPVKAVLVERAFALLFDFVARHNSNVANPQSPELLADLEQVNSQLRELCSWVYDPKSPSEERKEAQRIAGEYITLGIPADLALADIEKAGTRPRGKPVTCRTLAVTALEMRIKDSKLSWARLGNQLCRCGSKRHGAACSERIRSEVRELQKFLKRHAIAV
jgi:hypothetical protein